MTQPTLRFDCLAVAQHVYPEPRRAAPPLGKVSALRRFLSLSARARLPRPASQGICCILVLLTVALASPFHGQTSPTRPMIFGISHVSLLVTDYCRSLPFYSGLGGKARVPPCSPEDSSKSSGMGFLGQSSFIQLIGQPSPPSNALAEVGFWVPDVSAMREYLRAQGIDVENNKGRNLRVVDPEGHQIAFMGAASRVNSATPSNDEPRIIHAGFLVHDRAATEHFYKDILGFRPYWHGGMKDDGKDDWVSLQVPDGTDWIEMMVNVEANPDQHLRGIMNHIAIGVSDIHATEQRLKDAGVNLAEQPKIGRDGKWQLNVYDPDLTRVEFMEFKPVQKPCCSDFTGPHPQP